MKDSTSAIEKFKKNASLFCFHSSNIEAKTASRAKTASSVMVFED